MKTRFFTAALLLALSAGAWAQPQAIDASSRLQSQPVDVSADFHDATNNFFFADHLTSFDVQKAEGLVNWRRGCLRPRQAFNLNMLWPQYMQMLDFPQDGLRQRPRPASEARLCVAPHRAHPHAHHARRAEAPSLADAGR